MSAARQSSRPRKASARAREAAADAVDESDSDSGSDSEPDDVDGDDAWAQCDTCQKWRLLPKDHVVDEGAAWTCSLVGRSCDERADDAVEEPAGTVTPPLSVEPVSLKDLDTTPQRKKARALAADPAAIREAYAREKQDAGSERAPSQMRKKSEQTGCGGTRPEARNMLLEPLEEGSRHLGLACCVARGVIKYGSLRCMTIEKLGDYVSRGEAVYEHLGPKSKPHVDFVQRLEAELKFKNLSRYFYSSMCRCHLDNVTSLLHRVEKKLSSAAPGAAQAVPGRAGGAEMAGGGTKRQKVEPPSAMDEDDASDSDEEFMAPTVYARSPFRRGEKVLVPANAFGDDYAAENPETLSGTLICIKSVERDEAGEERRIWDVQYETGPFETDESFFDTDETRRVSSDEDDTPADLSDEAAAAATPKKRQRRDAG